MSGRAFWDWDCRSASVSSSASDVRVSSLRYANVAAGTPLAGSKEASRQFVVSANATTPATLPGETH